MTDENAVTEVSKSLGYRRAWREANRERVKAKKKEWNLKNADRLRELKKASYHRNIETAQRYRKANAEKIKASRIASDKKYVSKRRASARKYRAENRDKVKAWTETSRNKHRGSYLFYGIKKFCRTNDVQLGLTKEWIQQRLDVGVCEMTGIPFDLAGKRTAHSPSVDRYDPSGGYTTENCKVIVWFLNRAFSNAKKDDALDIFEAALRKARPQIFGGDG